MNCPFIFLLRVTVLTLLTCLWCSLKLQGELISRWLKDLMSQLLYVQTENIILWSSGSDLYLLTISWLLSLSGFSFSYVIVYIHCNYFSSLEVQFVLASGKYIGKSIGNACCPIILSLICLMMTESIYSSNSYSFITRHPCLDSILNDYSNLLSRFFEGFILLHLLQQKSYSVGKIILSWSPPWRSWLQVYMIAAKLVPSRISIVDFVFFVT